VIKSEKSKLRQVFLKKRQSLTSFEIQKRSQAICKKIKSLAQIENNNVIACYLAVNNEPELSDTTSEFLKIQKTIVIPAFFKTSKNYKFVKLSSLNKLKIGPYQIPQPSKLLPVDSAKIDLVLLPGLAFSEDGLRLGYGKGVYDRLLADTNALKIGVAYDFQVIDHFESESHDIKVDFVITEKRIIKTRNF